MKAIMYAVYSGISILVMSIIYAMVFKDSGKRRRSLNTFKRSLDETKIRIYKEDATRAHKQAKKYIEKVQKLSEKPLPSDKTSVDEAIDAWNND